MRLVKPLRVLALWLVIRVHLQRYISERSQVS
jgi:hypothetical protein